jgi:hypothetical protein
MQKLDLKNLEFSCTLQECTIPIYSQLLPPQCAGLAFGLKDTSKAFWTEGYFQSLWSNNLVVHEVLHELVHLLNLWKWFHGIMHTL